MYWEWEVPYPPLHISCNAVNGTGTVCSYSQGTRGATQDIWRRSSWLFLHLLALDQDAQRIDGEGSNWSVPSEIRAGSKLVGGIRDRGKTKKGSKRDCCEAKKPQHRVSIMDWETKARHKDIKLDNGCGNKSSAWRFQQWKQWQLNTQDIIQHHVFSCTVLWAGHINTLPAKSFVPNAQPAHL